MHPILGYFDRWSVKAGGAITLMASSAGDAPFETRIARVICGDPNPRGPGYREIAMPHRTDGSHAGLDQRTHLGSWVDVPKLDLPAGPIVICATIWPTTPGKARQTLFHWHRSDAATFWFGIDDGMIFAGAGTEVGVGRVFSGKRLIERAWYDVWASYDPKTGTTTVGQRPRQPHPLADDSGSANNTFDPDWVIAGPGRVSLAAYSDASSSDPHNAHFNGKLERPTIWAGVDVETALAAQRAPRPPARDAKGLVACWDFSIGIDTLKVTEIGPRGFHGTVGNLPTRAMTGANWTGEEQRWTHRPAEWGGIHFHDDDLGDVGWKPSLTIDVPRDWPSGIYAIHLKSAAGVDNVPFFVRPADGAKRARIAMLIPTVSYHVYGNFVRKGFGRNNYERAKAWGAITHTPDENPELGLSPYNYHSDGSGVAHATMARPMIDKRVNHFEMMDPAEHGSGTYWVNVDSYVVDWLTRKGFEHDVITDHDVHEEGAALLSQYSLVITGQHPEYDTPEMLDAFEGFLAQGGRFMYLGGNGFYWKTVFHKEAPWALEVRRAESGIRVWATLPGEGYHAFDGSYGGLWTRLARPAHALVGNGFSSQGTYNGHPYTVSDAILDPRVAFLREGIGNALAPGAKIGERGFMGGGAAGHELDRADWRLGTPRHALVVASGVVDRPDYKPVNEERLSAPWPAPHDDLIRSDIVFFETPSGGAVLSVGSMCFVGSLPIDGYDNTLTRMFTNAVRRFVDPTPFDARQPAGKVAP